MRDAETTREEKEEKERMTYAPSESEKASWDIDRMVAQAEQHEGTNNAQYITLMAKADRAREEWAAKYPREAACEVAEAWSGAAHDVKSGCGHRAMMRIKAGENHETVLAEMRAKWSAWTTEHVD